MKKPRKLTEDSGGWTTIKARENWDTLPDVVNQIRDTKVRETIKAFMHDFNLTRVRNQKDIAIGYQGVFFMILTMGLMGKDIRDTCKLLLDALNGYSGHMKAYLEVEFPKEIEERFNLQIDGIMDALRATIQPHEYKRIAGMVGIDVAPSEEKSETDA